MSGLSSILRTIIPTQLRAAFYPVWTAQATSRAFAGLRPSTSNTPGPLIVSGFFDEASGIGRAADLTLVALSAAGYKPSPFHLRPLLTEHGGLSLPVSAPGGAWLIHCNPDEGVRALAYVDPEEWRGRRRIGYWAWELPAPPPHWVRTAKLFDEIWAPSRFVADSLVSAGIRTPVRVMPHPVSLGELNAKSDRSSFSLSDSEFVVLTLVDFSSSIARKNLLGAIEIYKMAFPASGHRSRLIVKALGTETRPSIFGQATAAVSGRPDIQFLIDRLSADSTRTLIASSDVVLSPHRSEGFGLVLAESLLLGVPALATGWSGNLDFMSDIPELLIGCTLTRVVDPSGVYRARGQMWADPARQEAAEKLQALAASPELRRRLAQRGAEAVMKFSDAWTKDRLEQTPLGGAIVTS
jgi:glycosyltransferase involved in cell wall biosynthesis